MEAHYATVWETIADTIGDSDVIVQGGLRRTWSEYEDRAAGIAGALAETGVQPDSKVALYLHNGPEYLESYFGAFKQRAVPVNVNYRYVDDELAYLLENSDTEVVIFNSSLGERVARVLDRVPTVRRWIEVADDASHLDNADRYEEVIASTHRAPRIRRSPDDIGIIYTGGTTGMPKGVMTRIGDSVVGSLRTLPPLLGRGPTELSDIGPAAARLANSGIRAVSLVPSPLMHGAGIGLGANAAATIGGCIVLLGSGSFDAAEVWKLVEEERVVVTTVVGDTFALPMLRELSEGPLRDLSSLELLVSVGNMFSRETKTGLLANLPRLRIVDIMGSTEGAMARSIVSEGKAPDTGLFTLEPSARVLTEAGQPVAPGSDEIGMVAVRSAALGYYKDSEKTLDTFREFDGERWCVPGDYAMVRADGRIAFLGRGSSVINTGGEKVFAEEVEEVLKLHPAVEDCLVVGVADERLGQLVTAVVSLVSGAAVSESELIDHTRQRIASYKSPRRVIIVDVVPRGPNGKADYAEAHRQVPQELPALQRVPNSAPVSGAG